MAEIIERELSWEDIIENDSTDFVTLPEGDYDFKVTSFERAHHPGSAKLPPCSKAIVNISIESPDGTSVIHHNLFLHTKCEPLLCAFFSAIGQRKRGEKLRMNWNTVVGSKGRCKVGIRTYTKNNGETGTTNEIKRFYESEPVTGGTPPSFTPGAF